MAVLGFFRKKVLPRKRFRISLFALIPFSSAVVCGLVFKLFLQGFSAYSRIWYGGLNFRASFIGPVTIVYKYPA